MTALAGLMFLLAVAFVFSEPAENGADDDDEYDGFV